MTVTEKRIRFHLNRQQKLKSKRQNWDNLWQDLSDYFCPGRITAIRREEDGARKTKKIYDNTGADAAQKLAAGLYSRTVNPASKWFYITLETADEELENNSEINKWFDLARDRTQSVINKRGTGALYQTYCDLTSLCNAVLFIQEDPISGVSFRTYPIDRVDIAEDYRKQVEYFENKIRNMIGRKVYIRPECEEFYDENKELTTLSNNLRNNIFHNHWDFEIIDYDFGMLLLKRKTLKFWVSFDMVKERLY